MDLDIPSTHTSLQHTLLSYLYAIIAQDHRGSGNCRQVKLDGGISPLFNKIQGHLPGGVLPSVPCNIRVYNTGSNLSSPWTSCS